jgi:hypothetical protein
MSKTFTERAAEVLELVNLQDLDDAYRQAVAYGCKHPGVDVCVHSDEPGKLLFSVKPIEFCESIRDFFSRGPTRDPGMPLRVYSHDVNASQPRDSYPVKVRSEEHDESFVRWRPIPE